MKKNILQLLEETASKFPDSIALKDDKNEATFNEYLLSAKTIGSSLLKSTNSKYSRPIIVFVDRKIETIISFMGVLYSGNFYVPVDNRTPIERLKNIVDVLAPIGIIGISPADLKLAGDRQLDIPIFSYSDLVNGEINFTSLEKVRDNSLDVDPVYAIFTSGSTGLPKGVAICHKSVLDLSSWLVETFDFDQSDVIGNQTPFYFDASVKDIYISLKTGALLYIIPTKNFSFPQLLIDALIINKVTTILWATSAIVMTGKSGVLDGIELPSLKRVFFAGEAMFGKHYNIWKRKFPEAMFINLYGPTEVTVDCTYYIVDRDFEDNDVIPIGRNCNNKSVFLLDENSQIIEGEESGELAVRGTGLALGYYNNREQTDKVFIQNPLHNHYRDLIYKTGDHVRINKFNEIEFIGRKDFQIKHMGNRIELGEIEAAVYAINSVQHAACVYDLKNEKIVLFYSAINLISPGEFIKELSARLPKYMIPNRFEFLQDMPINANGKVDKKAIKEKLND